MNVYCAVRNNLWVCVVRWLNHIDMNFGDASKEQENGKRSQNWIHFVVLIWDIIQWLMASNFEVIICYTDASLNTNHNIKKGEDSSDFGCCCSIHAPCWTAWTPPGVRRPMEAGTRSLFPSFRCLAPWIGGCLSSFCWPSACCVGCWSALPLRGSCYTKEIELWLIFRDVASREK